MKRRLFLSGIGGAALATPYLSSIERSAKAAEGDPRRLVIFYTNNGCLTNRWFPSVEDGAIDSASLAGTTLEPLSGVADKLLFPRGLAMYPRGQVSVDGVSYFDPHDQGMGSKLTCSPIDSADKHYALDRSLDHVAAELVNPSTKTPLVLSVGFSGSDVKQVASYSAARTPFVPEPNPATVYSSLSGVFNDSSPSSPATEADYRVARGNSVIDLVREDLDSMRRQKMSGKDQQKIDDWLALLRETEQGIVVSASCNQGAADQLQIDSDAFGGGGRGIGGGGFGGGGESAFVTDGDNMRKLIALTMMCDANRVILMQWPGFSTFDWLGHEYDHHGLSHRIGNAGVGGPCVDGVIGMLNEIDQWYASRYALLVDLLNSVEESEGRTMLDNSAVMWLPELADGNAHNNNNLPIVIAGSAGGYFKQGASVALDSGRNGAALGTGDSEASCKEPGDEVGFNTGSSGGNVPINKLYTTLLNAIGAKGEDGGPIQSFGNTDNSEPFTIIDPGELAALKA